MNKSKSLGKTSKYIGVCFAKDRNKWRAVIYLECNRIDLGQFVNEIDAAKARDQATKKYFGEYGKLNF